MKSVLGIDAAWVAKNPSGVALTRADSEGRWECVALAPSYDSFIALADGNPVRWGEKPRGGQPEPERLLQAAEQILGGQPVTVVSVDMPISNEPIIRRRQCDRDISVAFGANGCGTHTPNPNSPGAVSDQLRASLADLGYELAVGKPPRDRVVIEVYPHPALLRLLNRNYRVRYKVSRARKFWPDLIPNQRANRLITKFQAISAGLTGVLQGIPDFLPPLPYAGSLNALKRYEDSLDALVCAWVGARYLDGCAIPYGDQDAAIWVPIGDC